MHEIGILGHFGTVEHTDGQTVKTRTVYECLKKRGYTDILIANTYFLRKRPIAFVWEFLCLLAGSKKIIVLLSGRGRRALFPILGLFARRREIYHYAIGGRLADEVAENKRLQKNIEKFQENWVESKALERKLQELKVKNVCYIPNFKQIKVRETVNLQQNTTEPFRFCMFSRVMREKGVEDAIRAIRRVNEKADRNVAMLDIYGPIEKGYEERFQYVLKKIGGGIADIAA